MSAVSRGARGRHRRCSCFPAAEDIQSVLAPQGPQAMQIAQLAWLLFAVGAAVLLVVVVALWLAMRGSARNPRAHGTGRAPSSPPE